MRNGLNSKKNRPQKHEEYEHKFLPFEENIKCV